MNYCHQNSTDHVGREMEEINNRRARLEERTKRVLDAKHRTIGIDRQALDAQVRERQASDQLERERNAYYDDQSNRFANTVGDMEAVRALEVRERRKQVDDFRHQQAKDKRHKDLVKLANSDNVYDMDTPFLKFAGEDLGRNQRVKSQQMMQQDWLSQQMNMLNDKNNFEQQEDANREARNQQIHDLRLENEMEASFQRRMRNIDQMNYNKLQAKQKRDKELNDRQRNQQENSSEIRTMLSSKVLNEGVGDMDGPSNFKGFTTAQRQRILDEQAVQIAQQRQGVDQTLALEQEWDTYNEQVRQTIVGLDDQHGQNKKDALMTLRRDREVQDKEKKERYKYLDDVIYQNPVKEEYYGQWGQGCR